MAFSRRRSRASSERAGPRDRWPMSPRGLLHGREWRCATRSWLEVRCGSSIYAKIREQHRVMVYRSSRWAGGAGETAGESPAPPAGPTSWYTPGMEYRRFEPVGPRRRSPLGKVTLAIAALVLLFGASSIA